MKRKISPCYSYSWTECFALILPRKFETGKHVIWVAISHQKAACNGTVCYALQTCRLENTSPWFFQIIGNVSPLSSLIKIMLGWWGKRGKLCTIFSLKVHAHVHGLHLTIAVLVLLPKWNPLDECIKLFLARNLNQSSYHLQLQALTQMKACFLLLFQMSHEQTCEVAGVSQ